MNTCINNQTPCQQPLLGMKSCNYSANRACISARLVRHWIISRYSPVQKQSCLAPSTLRYCPILFGERAADERDCQSTRIQHVLFMHYGFFAHGTNVYMCTRVHPHVHVYVRSYPSNSRTIAFVIVEMDEGGDRRRGKPRTIKTLSEKKKLRRQRNLRYRQKMSAVNVTIQDAVDIRRIGDKEGISDKQVVTLLIST